MTTQTSERRAFLDQIRACPDEDTPRLVYADWLQENGEQERAEFIRVQVGLAKLPPRPRELFVADGAGKRLEGLGVALIPRGDGHYTASNAERGLSIESFAPGERVDVYAHFARNDRVGWVRGLRYVRTVESRNEIVFRKDAGSGPWAGSELLARERALFDGIGAGGLPNFHHWFRVTPYVFPENPTVNEREYADGTFNAFVRRGFLESLRCPAERWLCHADALLAEHPVRRVTLTDYPQVESEREMFVTTVWLAGRPQTRIEMYSAVTLATGLNLLRAAFPGIEFTLPVGLAP